MKHLCVFCGSSAGHDPVFAQCADELGRLLAERQVELIYGGGTVGLMGRLARACLEAGGRVIGVIPRSLLEREVALETATELVVTETMHQRKAEMARRADAFLALPGGLGTFEELFEMLTWTQLGLQDKPCAVWNLADYYRPLLMQIELAVERGFIHPGFAGLLLHHRQLTPLLDAMIRWQRPAVDKVTAALDSEKPR